MKTIIKTQNSLDRKQALAWMVQQLRWERVLIGLRSNSVGQVSLSKIGRQAA